MYQIQKGVIFNSTENLLSISYDKNEKQTKKINKTRLQNSNHC